MIFFSSKYEMCASIVPSDCKYVYFCSRCWPQYFECEMYAKRSNKSIQMCWAYCHTEANPKRLLLCRVFLFLVSTDRNRKEKHHRMHIPVHSSPQSYMEQLFSPVFKEFLKTFPLSLSPSPLSFCLSPVSFSIAYFFLGSHLTSTFLCAVKLYFYLVTCQKVCQTFEYMERVSDHLANIPMPLYVQICI